MRTTKFQVTSFRIAEVWNSGKHLIGWILMSRLSRLNFNESKLALRTLTLKSKHWRQRGRLILIYELHLLFTWKDEFQKYQNNLIFVEIVVLRCFVFIESTRVMWILLFLVRTELARQPLQTSYDVQYTQIVSLNQSWRNFTKLNWVSMILTSSTIINCPY